MSDNNKTRILFVAAGLAQVDSILWAKENNFYVISLDQDKNALGKEFSDEFYVGDITSEKIIIEIFKRAGADGIVSVSCDAALIPVSKACEILNIPGISYQESILSKNKYLKIRSAVIVPVKLINIVLCNNKPVHSSNHKDKLSPKL